MTTIKYKKPKNWTETVITITLTVLIFVVIIGYISLMRNSGRETQLAEAQEILDRAEIDVELEKNVRIWLFATDEGRVIYYDGKLFKATELE